MHTCTSLSEFICLVTRKRNGVDDGDAYIVMKCGVAECSLIQCTNCIGIINTTISQVIKGIDEETEAKVSHTLNYYKLYKPSIIIDSVSDLLIK
jgi:hypothetical protein